eukprot:928882-Rhodomonas_salina.1
MSVPDRAHGTTHSILDALLILPADSVLAGLEEGGGQVEEAGGEGEEGGAEDRREKGGEGGRSGRQTVRFGQVRPCPICLRACYGMP